MDINHNKINTIQKELWLERPYYSLDAYLKNTFGRRLHKIALDAGFTCPNRDGTLDSRGCIFCSAGGSGDFAVSMPDFSASLSEIMTPMSSNVDTQCKPDKIAYFQAFTNTYAPVERLEMLYREALNRPDVAGISIATRPDCLPPDVLALLGKLHQEFFISREKDAAKFIWIELGLQTIHEKTADYIRRGYCLDVFDTAVTSLNQLNIPVIVHIILGLPGETKENCLETIQYLNQRNIFGIKLQLLHVLTGTDLYEEYKAGKFAVLTKDEYIDMLVDCVGHLRSDIVIHRLTGDGPKDILAAPIWSRNKRDVLNTFHHEMKVRKMYQGKLLHE